MSKLDRLAARLSRQAIYNADAIYTIHEGTGVLIPRTYKHVALSEFWDEGFTIRRCVPFTTIKEVLYTEKDVGYDPQTKLCYSPITIEIMAERDSYYAFKLPVNNKHIPYIFVDYDDVVVVKNRYGPKT